MLCRNRFSSKIAQMHDFILSLDEGYETYVGERGSTLSGGQRQRMAIARAVILDPPILILDDSTSSVDANTEDQIKKAMESVMEGRTTFVIANRLSTVHSADQILVMNEGEIVEQGNHQENIIFEGVKPNGHQIRNQHICLRPTTIQQAITIAKIRGGEREAGPRQYRSL